MTVKAGQILVNEIVPRIRSIVPRSVLKIGSEDNEEVIQDTIAMAARLLDRNERNGKPTAACCIAFYSLQHAKSGRRMAGTGKTDAMGPRTQLEGRSAMVSFDEIIHVDELTNEPVTLGDMLADGNEDPSTIGARNIDWEEFLVTQGKRPRAVVRCSAEGGRLQEVADRFKVSYSTINDDRQKLATSVRAYMGDDVLDVVKRLAPWQGNLRASREKLACRERHRGI
jgi:hypothetical protein